MPMPKKKPSAIPDDPVNRKALQDGIKKLSEHNFASWTPSLTEAAVLQVAYGLEKIAEGLRNLVTG